MRRVFQRVLRGVQELCNRGKFPTTPYYFLAGFLAVIAGSALVVAALVLSAKDLKSTAALIFAANIPLALVEGALTLFIVLFLAKTKPDALKRS